MFSYTVSREASNDKFKRVCEKIEKNIRDIRKEKIIVDVDGTLIQIYYADEKKIKVVNDYEIDAVYVDSEIEIENILVE